MKRNGFLFAGEPLSVWLDNQMAGAIAAVRALDPEVVLGTPEADLIEWLFEKHRAEPLRLRLDEQYTAGAQDAQIDVSGDYRRSTFDRSRPHYIQGTQLTLQIPFDGGRELFRWRPSSCSSVFPRGEVRATELVLSHRLPADEATGEAFAQALRDELSTVEKHVAWVNADCAAYNERLREELGRAVPQRKQKVLRDRDIEAFLRIPVGRRPYVSPALRVAVPKRRPPTPRIRSQTPYQPEPAISPEDFSEILEAIREWTGLLERLPNTFAPMGEGALRDNLLVSLNRGFGDIGAEVFSRGGRADILIRHRSGAVFIAECKFWNGPKKLQKAMDQLLGYLTWRDTRAALILFVRQRNVTSVIQRAERAIASHLRFKRTVPPAGGTPVHVLHHEDDTNREIHVALVVVPVPSPDANLPDCTSEED